MGMIALRIPDQMKREMARIKLNWSDYLRRSISEALESKQKRELIEKVHKLLGHKKRVETGTAAHIMRMMRDRA